MCRWATARGDLDTNPMMAMKLPAKSAPRERVLTPDEIKHVWKAMADEPVGETVANCLRLILATAQRPGEVSGIAMSELDLDARVWTIPAERHKSLHQHVVPLSVMAVRLIRAQRAAVEAQAAAMDREPGPWLFPTYRRTRGAEQSFGPLLSGGLSHAVQRRGEEGMTMGIPHWTAHDLRRTAATMMEESGVNPFVVAHVLGHISVTKSSVTNRHYAHHTYEAEKRAALDGWGKRLSALVDGRSADKK
jgi:integrase